MRIKKKPPVKSIDQSILVKNDKLNKFYAPHHYHQDYEIIYIKKSRGIRVVGNSIDNYNAGEVVILGPRLPHYHVVGEVKEDDALPIETIAVLFPESIFELNQQYPEFSKMNNLLEQIKYGIELKENTCSMARKILEGMTLEPTYRNFVSLFNLLDILSTNKSRFERLSTVKYENKRLYNEKTKHVLDYILDKFQETISVGELATHAGMSISGFCVFFKSQTGYTFSHYLNMLRISKACELLATTKKGISEIAYEVGYENLAYFNRKFKEIKQFTPREVRCQLRH